MQLPIKVVGIVLIITMPVLFLRVGHKNPQLITSLFNQTARSQPSPQRDNLELKANQCGKDMKVIVTMSDKQLNDFVYDCGVKK